MKKSLMLAMAMTFAICGGAYAANPFSDVPAGHWAYDSISKLAAAGVVEGYGDNTFRGDRLMTRYEMAQMVAKAMAKGANVDKLAAEFADELDALGVRVERLEKNQDNVKITGQARYHYENYKIDGVKGHTSKLRTRLWLTGKVNDNWNYVSMLENQQDFTTHAGDEDTKFQRAYLDGRLGGTKVQAGRINKVLFDSMVYGSRMDGIDVKYGDKVKLNAYYGKATNSTDYSIGEAPDYMYGAGVSADVVKNLELHAGYDHFKVKDALTDKDEDRIVNAGFNYKFANRDANFGATYLHADADGRPESASKNGFMLGLDYKGAKVDKPGSWGIGAKYYQTPAGISISSGWDTTNAVKNFYNEGFKGWFAKANYAVAKNMIAGVEYWNMKGRESGDKANALWTDFTVTF